MKKYSIFIVALTANIIVVYPTVWKRVKTGDYAIVLASLEIFLQYVFVFLFCNIHNRGSAFNKHLVCIAIDEMHLIWTWRIFRKVYARLEILRHYFPKVPMMTLSATIMSNVLGYIRELLHL